MNEIKRHEFYKQIILDAYHLSKKEMKKKYNIVNYDNDIITGFKSYAIRVESSIIFATIGTNSVQDLNSDKRLFCNKIPSHVNKLKTFAENTMKTSSLHNCEIIFTGHSLGASANTIVATKYIAVSEVVNFNPFGTKEIIGERDLKYPKTNINRITNYCNLNDDVATYKLSTQVGKCYTIYTNNLQDAHFIDHIAPLTTRKLFDQNDKTLETRIRQRLKTIKKIKSIIKNTKNINNQKFKDVLHIGLSQENTNCSGSYPVSGYTRKDGTKVDSYTRTCYKHSGGNMTNNIKVKNIPEKFAGKKLQDLSEEEIIEAISYFV